MSHSKLGNAPAPIYNPLLSNTSWTSPEFGNNGGASGGGIPVDLNEPLYPTDSNDLANVIKEQTANITVLQTATAANNNTANNATGAKANSFDLASLTAIIKANPIPSLAAAGFLAYLIFGKSSK
jgi:hypothetical protein